METLQDLHSSGRYNFTDFHVSFGSSKRVLSAQKLTPNFKVIEVERGLILVHTRQVRNLPTFSNGKSWFETGASCAVCQGLQIIGLRF